MSKKGFFALCAKCKILDNIRVVLCLSVAPHTRNNKIYITKLEFMTLAARQIEDVVNSIEVTNLHLYSIHISSFCGLCQRSFSKCNDTAFVAEMAYRSIIIITFTSSSSGKRDYFSLFHVASYFMASNANKIEFAS